MEGPAQIDLDSKRQIIQHFRDLILLSRFLDYDAEMFKFIKMLREHGWAKSLIDAFVRRAGQGTFYETLIDSPIPNAGDFREYRRNKARWKK